MQPLPSGPQAAIISLAIRFRGIVVALAVVLLGYGFYALGQARYDVFPEFAPPQVAIQTEAPGFTPEQVETLVTRPVENVIGGAPGVTSLRSSSIQGLSIITAYFDPASDIYRDRQVIAEQLTVATQRLPSTVLPPVMTPLTSSTGLVLVAGLTSSTRSPMELRTAADWVVRLRLLAVPGVADVGVFGGEVRSIQIQIHPEKLVQFGLSLDDVLAAARRATGVRAAGFVDTPNQRVLFQTEGQSSHAEDIAHTVLLRQGAGIVTLANVATIAEAPEPSISGASVQGKPGVVLNVAEQYGADTVRVSKAVETALTALRPSLEAEGITLHMDLFRPANFIDTAIHNVRTSLLAGGALVVLVLFLFLFDLRTAAISCTAIPLSLVAGALVLGHFGYTLNTMTLGGLAIAIGEVVDDAVIGVENAVRRLRENRRLAEPRPEARVILEAAFEVRTAVVYATFAVLLVFLPILALPGIAGRLFAPLGLAYILAVLLSLAVALTLTPALAMALLTGRRALLRDPSVVHWTRGRYVQLLQGVARRPRLVFAVAVAFTVVGCVPLLFFGGSFIPELKEGHLIVHMTMVPGTSLAEGLRMGAHVTETLNELSAVRSVAQRVGRAERGVDTGGTNTSEFEVDLKPLSGDAAETVQAEVRNVLGSFVGANFAVNSFLTERVDETLSGYTAPVVVNLFGSDLDKLDQAAQAISRVLGSVPGATEVQVQSPPGLPQLTIRLRRADLERWGLDSVSVLDAIRVAYQGDVVSQAYDGDTTFNVTVLLDPKSRANLTAVGDLPLRAPDGAVIPLHQLADIYEATGRYQVQHEGGRRLQTITANVGGRDVVSFVRDSEKAIRAGVALPPGSYLEFAGAAQAQAQSQRALVLNGLLAGAGIVLLLSVVTRNWRNLLLVTANLPFALVGGVLAVFATGGMLTLGSMVGFVTLFGITLRNSIMMISHYEHLVQVEGQIWNAETAVEGAADRLVPILMTSLVTALGLLPLAIGMSDAGREIEGPMAVVILGGLLTSMALNLLVLPTLALLFGRFDTILNVFEIPAPL